MRSISVHYKFDLLRNPASVSWNGTATLDCEGMDRLPQTISLITITLSGQSDQKAEVLGGEGEIFHGELAWILVLLLLFLSG